MSNAMLLSLGFRVLNAPRAIIGGWVRATSPGWRAGLRLLVMALGVALLTGCSAVRLAYNQGPNLAYWWFDDYVDFNAAQSPRAEAVIDDWFRWHRREELPRYAELLGKASEQLGGPVSAEQTCGWFDVANTRAEVALERALPGLAEVAMQMRPAQLVHLERKYAEIYKKIIEDYLQPDPQARAQARLKQALKPIEFVFGEMSDEQRTRIAALALQTPFEPERWIAERRRRQQDTLQTLRQISAPLASAEQATTALRALAQRSRLSPDDDYRAYQQRLVQFNCRFAAEVHQLTTQEQRRAAAGQFTDWADDARALAAKAQP